MNYQDILAFVTQNPVCTLSTCQEGQPHARGFLTNIIEGKIYFTTSASKAVGEQIAINPKAELCYFNSDFSTMLRITTTLKISSDKKIKQYLIDNREYLKGFSADDSAFYLLTLSDSSATFWTLADNMKESQLEKIPF